MKFDDRIDEIYESLKRSARGNWRYDATTMTLVIHLDDQNIIKVNIPNRDIGSFLARSPNRVAWLLESIYAHRDIALQLLPKEVQDKYMELVQGRLDPSDEEVDETEEQNETEEAPVPA